MRHSDVPQFTDQKFYKYRPWNQHTANAIADCELYFANPSEVNDPFDCRFPKLRAPRDELERLAYFQRQYLHLRDPNRERGRFHGGVLLLDALLEAAIDHKGMDGEPTWEAVVQKASEIVTDRSSFCSLSEVDNNALMWAHYAGGHSGVCLEFHFTLHYALSHIEAVSYAESPSTVDVFDEEHEEEELVIAAMYEKHQVWEYEREWRAFNLRAGRGIVRFDPRCLSGVILGAKMAEEQRLEVMEVIARSPANPEMYEAVVEPDSYSLSIRSLRESNYFG